ncbi:EcsC family protein [Clostridium swellfunianum]|uniref:EcsC family protein n=1 Tax=Clostridium swellfunianum TaxID=1367462 RepID=UPI00202FA809|nr:EcsC family protein [Clostridium swellfunianum]MCM0649192.1 EcsC family protein [Clostridium swellfunianum]
MNIYEEHALQEMKKWQREISKKPSIINKMTKGIQRKTNNLIPEKAHRVITETIKNISKTVIIGSEYITRQPLVEASLEERERQVLDRLNFYRKAAVVEGAGTGAGGILLGLADFPLLLSLKMKFLFDTASIYGFDVRDYRERLYILFVFQLAFSSRQRQVELYYQMENWENYVHSLPMDMNDFDWRTFQQEYRDYIDLAKLMQLVPGIGAVVGAYANYKLMDKLGETALNAYRMRVFRKV